MSQRTIGSTFSLMERLEDWDDSDDSETSYFDRHQTRTLLEEHGNSEDELVSIEEALGGGDTRASGYLLLDRENQEAAYLTFSEIKDNELKANIDQKGDMSEVIRDLAQSYRNNARINEDPEYLVE